jgi:hypothetical protein
MSNGTKCKCPRCTCSGLMWPVVLITIGVLFLAGHLHWGYSFSRLWPVLLIVIGLVKLAEALASTEGHIGPGGSPAART